MEPREMTEAFETGFLSGFEHAASCAEQMLTAGMTPAEAINKLGKVSAEVLKKHAGDARGDR